MHLVLVTGRLVKVMKNKLVSLSGPLNVYWLFMVKESTNIFRSKIKLLDSFLAHLSQRLTR